MRILYITFDGVLEPLGYAQVVRVVTALARRGYPYVLLSLEKAERLADAERVASTRRALDAAGVPWIVVPYAGGSSARAATKNVACALMESVRAARRFGVKLVHARAYHAATIALALRRALRVPYLFDARGYWIDERAEEGRWFGTDRTYRVGKSVERALYRNAAGIVSLTNLQADDLRGGTMGDLETRCIEVITTIADFDAFQIERKPLGSPEIAEALRGKTVLGWVGSFNSSYLQEPTLRLMSKFLDRKSSGMVVALTAQVDVCRGAFAAAGLPANRTLIREVSHDEMPRWLPHLDWGALLLKTSFAKRGSMPTKLGELLASGVRPVHCGCNAEVGEWVRRAGSGISLTSVESAELDRAVDRMLAQENRGEDELRRARAIAEPHYGLASGIETYASILERLLASAPRQVR